MNYHNSKVTLELGEMVDSGVKVWDFDYPSYYKGEEKTAFEQLVIDHYRFRQIGMETPGRWLHSFRTRIREIMPYYIQLYKSVELMMNVDDPFKAYDLTETFTKETSDSSVISGESSTEDSSTSETSGQTSQTGSNSTEGTSNKSGSNASERKFSNTPQGSISNIEDYMTEATKESGTTGEDISTAESGSSSAEGTSSENGTTSGQSSSTTSGTSENTGKETYTLKRFGNIGVQPLGQEIEAYRKALINVDLMVINELKDLFLKVY